MMKLRVPIAENHGTRNFWTDRAATASPARAAKLTSVRRAAMKLWLCPLSR